MSPTTRSIKKKASSNEKQRQEEEALFQGGSTDIGNNTDAQESIDNSDEVSSALEFATPKVSVKHTSSKGKVAPTYHQTQTASQTPSCKRTVDQTFFFPTPISNKARRSQPIVNNAATGQSKQLLALIALVSTPSEEIGGLKDMIAAQSKEISVLRSWSKNFPQV